MPPLNRHDKKAVNRKLSPGHMKKKEAEKKLSEPPGSPSHKYNDAVEMDEVKKEKGEDEDEDEDEGEEKPGDSESKGFSGTPADAMKTIIKIFPSSIKNEDGYYISDIRILTDPKKNIMNSLDFELENMLDHISNLSKASQFPTKKETKDAGGYIDPSKLDMKNYMKHDTTEFLILPTKYEDAKNKKKGGKSSKKPRKRNGKRTRKENP
jgi:hypothetical protein